jgi:hypothetical protein
LEIIHPYGLQIVATNISNCSSPALTYIKNGKYYIMKADKETPWILARKRPIPTVGHRLSANLMSTFAISPRALISVFYAGAAFSSK